MDKKYEILEFIDDLIDIENFVRPNVRRGPSGIENEWFNKLKEMNKELKIRNLIGEFQNVFFEFGFDNKIKHIHLQRETRCIEPENTEKFNDVDGNEITVRRRDLVDIENEIEHELDFNKDEWKNYRRTKLMDRMLND